MRYVYRVNGIIEAIDHEMKAYEQRYLRGGAGNLHPDNEIPNHRFWEYANRFPKEEIKQGLTAATPKVVQWLLGQSNIDSASIRKYALPVSQEHRRKRSCHGDFVVHNNRRHADCVGSSGDLWTRYLQH